MQVVKKHKNCHQAYIDRLVSEATVTEDEIDTTHSRIQKILQARRKSAALNCMRIARLFQLHEYRPRDSEAGCSVEQVIGRWHFRVSRM